MTDDKEAQGWCGKRPDGRLMIITCVPDKQQSWDFVEAYAGMKRSGLLKAGWTVVRVTVQEQPND